jgi:hypothetical protein
MRAQRQRAAEVAVCCGSVAEAPLDHPAVEQFQGIVCSEP